MKKSSRQGSSCFKELTLVDITFCHFVIPAKNIPGVLELWVDNQNTTCLSVFDYFVGLKLKGLMVKLHKKAYFHCGPGNRSKTDTKSCENLKTNSSSY